MPFAGIISSPTRSQSPVIGRSKTLTNNAVNNLFTFPLASGAMVGFAFCYSLLAKKTTSWAFLTVMWMIGCYNDGSALQFTKTADGASGISESGGLVLLSADKTSGGTVDANEGTHTPSATLSNNVVTFKFHPGNVGVAPDSIKLTYAIIAPTPINLTYL